MPFRLPGKLGLALLAALAGAPAAHAAANLIVNGDFEASTLPVSAEFGSRYLLNQVAGWATGGYNFRFAPGTADTTGAIGEYGNLALWGPNNGGAAGNTLPATSPVGGAFIAADGAFGTADIVQTVDGLTIGSNYELSFYWAAAQQAGFTGNTTEAWQVRFGTQDYMTPIVTTLSKGFTPWRQETVTFRATATSQVLSFLAYGTPSGVPPFSLLDGVTLYAAPEPGTWALVAAGLLGIAALRRRRA